MRRSDREITDEQELLQVISECDVCRLALNDEEVPYILPLNFGEEVSGGAAQESKLAKRPTARQRAGSTT